MPPSEFKALRNSPIVMAWRRVSNLDEADRFAKVANWARVGDNKYARIYDAGTLLVGYWVQEKFVSVVAKDAGVQPDELKGKLIAAAANKCGGASFDKFALVSNPATHFVGTPADFQGAVNKLGRALELPPAIVRSETGQSVSFVDSDGNFSGLFRPGGTALSGRLGDKLKVLMKRGTLGGPTRATAARGRLVGFDPLVSDLPQAQKFFGDVLSIKPLTSSRTETRFDAGPVILHPRQGPA